MKRKKKKKRLSLQDKAMLALREAVKEVIENHKKSGRPLPIWEKGKLKYISAKEALRKWH